MKQTSGALSFLLSAYRSIFSSAYTKGIAAAVVLTAGLSAGAAQAEDNVLADTYADTLADVTVNDKVTVGDKAHYAGNVTVVSGGSLVSPDAGSTAHLYIDGNLDLQQGATLTLSGSATPHGIVGISGNKLANGNEDWSHMTGTLTANGATISVTKSQIQMASIDINNSTVTLGDNGGDAAGSDWSDNAQLTATNENNTGILTIRGADSKVNLNQGSILNASTVNLNGGTVTMAGTNADDKFAIIRGFGDGIVNINGAKISASTAGNYILGADINVSSDVTVAENGVLTFAGKTETAKNGDSNLTAENNADLNATADIDFTGGTLTNAGSITFMGDTTFAGTAAVNNASGDISVDGDLTTTASALEGITKGKLTMSTAGADINVSDAVDLNKLGILKADDGTLDANKLVITTSANLNADDVTLGHTYAVGADKLTLNVKNLTATTTKRAGVAGDKIADGGFYIDNGTINVSDSIELTAGEGITGQTRVYVYGASGDSNLNLVNDGSVTGTLVNVDRVYVGYTSDTAPADHNSSLTTAGSWDFGNSRLTVGKSGSATLDGVVTGIESLSLKSDGDVTIAQGATVSVQRLLGNEGGTGTLAVNGTLNITGDGKADTPATEGGNYTNDVYLANPSLVVSAGGTISFGRDAWDDFIVVTAPAAGADFSTVDVKTPGNNTQEYGGWASGNATINGVMSIDLGNIVLEDKNAVTGLKDKLFNDDSTGVLNIGSASYEVKANDDGSIDYGNIAEGVSNSQTDHAVVNVAQSNNTSGIVGEFGSVSLTADAGSTLNVKASSTLILNQADEGVFVSNASGDTANVTVKSGSSLVLNGAGEIGAITKDSTSTAKNTGAVLNAGNGTQTVNGAITLDTVKVTSGTVNVDGNVSVTDALTLNGNLSNVKEGETRTVNAGTLTQTAGTLTTGTLTFGASSSDTGTASTAAGSVVADTININSTTNSTKNSLTITGVVNATTVNASGATINVGTAATEDAAGDNGYFVVEKLDLGEGMLLLDPEYGMAATVAAVTGADTDTVIGVNGDIGVGQNSVGVFGTDDAEARDVISRLGWFDGNGSLSADNVGSVLYLAKGLSIASGDTVMLDANMDHDELADAIDTATGTSGLNGSGGSVTLGANTAIVVSDEFTQELTKSGSTEALFTFEDTTNKNSLSITASNGSQIVFDSSEVLGGATVTVATGVDATSTVNLSNADITAANGLLTATQDSTDDNQLVFKLSENAGTHLYNQSNPVKALTIEVVGNESGEYTVGEYTGVDYITALNAHNGGADIEATARLATYAGAVQATFMAQQTSTDAVADRMGMASVNSALVYADNAQGGGLWLMPVYKNHDSDSFDAQGVDYGADIDLYGVALGADFTTDTGVRVGAYFNVGSGDADGQGVASDVSNDFDYFGLGLYAGMSFGNFGLTADAGFTQVSNDIEQSVNYHDIGKVTADTDTTAVTVGVKGEYKLATAFVDVIPHVGVRYTSFDMDSYDARADGEVVATTSADTMTVFSIPFGVSLSKEIAAGDWTVKPAFDLTLTANTGDTELDTDTTFTGTNGLGLSTEVLDDFTYGGALGIQAKYGESLSLGVSASYVGSDNADEFGVTGDIRYMF